MRGIVLENTVTIEKFTSIIGEGRVRGVSKITMIKYLAVDEKQK